MTPGETPQERLIKILESKADPAFVERARKMRAKRAADAALAAANVQAAIDVTRDTTATAANAIDLPPKLTPEQEKESVRLTDKVLTVLNELQIELAKVGYPWDDKGTSALKEYIPRYIALMIELAKIIGKKGALAVANRYYLNITHKDHGGQTVMSVTIYPDKNADLLTALQDIN